jgi:hypothetical protein
MGVDGRRRRRRATESEEVVVAVASFLVVDRSEFWFCFPLAAPPSS